MIILYITIITAFESSCVLVENTQQHKHNNNNKHLINHTHRSNELTCEEDVGVMYCHDY